MTRINQLHPGRFARIGRRLAILVLPAALVVGCSDNNNPPPAAPTATSTSLPATATRTSTTAPTQTPVPATPTSTPNASAGAACQKLATCGQCFIDSTGTCITDDACATRLSGDVATCVNGVGGCDADTLGNCLFPGCDGTAATEECQ